MGLMVPNGPYPYLRNILKNSLIHIFVRYLSYSLWKIHRKLTSGYLLCDKATLIFLLEGSDGSSTYTFFPQ